MKSLPSIKPNLALSQVGDEMLVYSEGQAHCLTPVAAKVFAACQQGKSFSECQLEIERAECLSSDEADSSIREALHSLSSVGILSVSPDELPRRRFLAGAVAAGAVAVSTVVLPEPALAASACTITGTATVTNSPVSDSTSPFNVDLSHTSCAGATNQVVQTEFDFDFPGVFAADITDPSDINFAVSFSNAQWSPFVAAPPPNARVFAVRWTTQGGQQIVATANYTLNP